VGLVCREKGLTKNLVQALPQEGGGQLELRSWRLSTESFDGQKKVLFGRVAASLLPIAVGLDDKVGKFHYDMK
jgi:hypothetical protein